MKTALLIIDMQHDFVHPKGVLYVRGAYATVPAIMSLREKARSRDWEIIHVVRAHDAQGENADRPRRHLFCNGGKGYCVYGTPGAAIIPELTPREGERLLLKTRNSAFCRTSLESQLRSLGVERVVIAGTQYPNCIRATANDAMSLDFETVVVVDCCSAKDDDVAYANVKDMINMGIRCVSSTDI